MHDWYEKKWFIKLEGQEEGPYCKAELRNMAKVTPDTLCRLAGETEWKPIKFRPELRDLFEQSEENQDKTKRECKPIGEELILDYSQEPSPFLFWLIIILLLLLISLYPTFFRIWN